MLDMVPDNQPGEQCEILPQIRQDLAIEKASAGWNGDPNWLIHDRIKNRFFRIGANIVYLLRIWRPIEVDQFVKDANASTNIQITKEQVLELAQFLYANSLTTSPASGGYSTLLNQSLAGKKSWWMALVHNYLFFRIPLARPQGFLDKTWPFVRGLFSRRAAIVFVMMAIVALYLVSRQWDVFLATFSSFLSLEGFALYALSLVMIKTLHELGHAYMAKRYDIEVPTIGVAFIVMMPILYTDTTAAWRLGDKKHRLMIDFAGIFTELALASICTLAWVFLPDGNLRAIAFTTATLSWVLSLTINLNPFMKFDGYYILSDSLGFENLQERGFALARWWLREKLFSLEKTAPEELSPNLQKFIVFHAIGTWIYRFFLFLAIALLIYFFFFKVLGVFLFVVELLWFIALPIWRELKEWWKMKDEIKSSSRTKWTFGIVVGILIFASVPWSTTVRIPAIMTQSQETRLNAQFPAKIAELFIRDDMPVKAGQVLVRLESPELMMEFNNAKLNLSAINARLARAHADIQDRSQIQVLIRQSKAVERNLAGIRDKMSQLNILAPHDGMIVDIELDIHPGLWIDERVQLATVLSVGSVEFKALADEKSRMRLKNNAGGLFIPDDLQLPAIEVQLTRLANVAGTGEELAYLGEESGSVIAMQPTQSGKRQPTGAWFALRLKPVEMPIDPDVVVRGVIVLDASPQSFFGRVFRQIASVLVREAGI
ncbi:MAG: biotin/lipoyl-binding protein [Rhizobiaceae bacterium]|nr:biotin/lipoyl-binding protein [Rhizobiaceae bacterium]